MILRFNRNYLDFKSGQEYDVTPETTAKYILAMSIAKKVIGKDGAPATEPKKLKKAAEKEAAEKEAAEKEAAEKEAAEKEAAEKEAAEKEAAEKEAAEKEAAEKAIIKPVAKKEVKAAAKKIKEIPVVKTQAEIDLDELMGF